MAIYPSLLGTTASRSPIHSNGSGNSLESRHSQQKPVETQNGVKKNRKKSKKTEKKEKSSRKKKGKTTEKAETFPDDESQIDLGGSPWDPTERKHLKLEDLDLHKSYVDDYEKAGRASQEQEQEERTERPSSRRKWNYKGQKPLTDIPKLIEMEWDTREPDLDPTDLQGQIQRCKERIEENIMPSFFEERLRRFEAENNALIAIQRSESQNLSESAITRIASLRETELGLQQKGNTSQLVNVQAILAAYRSKALGWTAGLVTYWSGGQQLCQPRPFSWDEFEAINDACNRSESFWVEGLFGLSRRMANSSLTVPCASIEDGTNFYNIALRLPGRNWWTELEFQYDTGCADMLLFQDDLNLIAGPERDPVRVIRTESFHGIGGSLITPIIELEGTILDAKGRRMGPWITFCCRIDDTDYRGLPPDSAVPGTRRFPRLDGGLFRKYYYYMLSPDEAYTLKIADSRHSLFPIIRGLKKEDRVHFINRRMQYGPDENAPPQNLTLDALGNAERALLEADRPVSPPAERRFFGI